MLNRETVIQCLTRTCTISREQADRAFSLAWDCQGTNGWYEVLKFLDEVVYVICGYYIYPEDLAPEQP